MRCGEIREAISSRLDGEDGLVSDARLGEHLAGCAACQAYQAEASRLHRSLRLGRAPAVPDRTARILAAIAPRGTPLSVWRGVLMGAGLAKLLVGLANLGVGADAAHLAREVAAWDIALAVALLSAAWQPVRALGLFPLLAAAVTVMLVAVVADVSVGNTRLIGEVHHVIEAVGLVALGRVAAPMRALRAARA